MDNPYIDTITNTVKIECNGETDLFGERIERLSPEGERKLQELSDIKESITGPVSSLHLIITMSLLAITIIGGKLLLYYLEVTLKTNALLAMPLFAAVLFALWRLTDKYTQPIVKNLLSERLNELERFVETNSLFMQALRKVNERESKNAYWLLRKYR